MKSLSYAVFFSLLLLISGNVVSAAEGSGNEEWDPVSAGTVTTWTAPLMEKGKLAVQPFFFYNHTRGSFDADGDFASLSDGDEKEQYQQSLFFQYGLTDTLEFDTQLFYQQNLVETGGSKASGQGLGDSYAFLKYSLVKDHAWWPETTALFQLKVPTGKYQKADPDKLEADITGTGSYDHGYGLIFTKKIKPFVFHADAIYTFPVETTVDSVDTLYGQYLNYDIGAEYFFYKGFNLAFEVNGYVQRDMKQDGDYVPSTDSSYVTVSPGIGWSNDTIQTLLAYQRVVAGINADANDSVVLTCVYEF